MEDPDQRAEARRTGHLSNVMIREPLANQMNLSYIGELYLGSGEPQKVRAIFDTGSANPWILSKQAADEFPEGCEVYPFNPRASPTFEAPDDPKYVTITFGSGSLTGYFVTD